MSLFSGSGAPDRITHSSHRFYGWRLLAVLWALYFLNLGVPLYGGAVVNAYMLRQIAMPRSVYGLGFAIYSFFLGILSMAVAASIHRWGVRATFSIGMALLLSGSLWMAFLASHPWQYLLGFGVLNGSAAAFSTIVPVTTTVTRWFRIFRGRAMAIAQTASGVAGFVVAPAMNKLMAATGGDWKLAWKIVGVVAILSASIAWLAVKEHPEDLGQLPDGASVQEADGVQSGSAGESDWTLREAFGRIAFWALFVCSIACHYPFNFFTAHGFLFLKGLGIAPSVAALATGFFTMGIMGGSLLGGVLVDKLPARFACMSGLLFYIVSSLLYTALAAKALGLIFAAAILYGMGFGCTFVCLNTVIGNFFGAKSFAKINGMIFLLSTIVCAFSAYLGGRIFDLWNSYVPAFGVNVLLCLAAICALSLAHPPQRSEAREPLRAGGACVVEAIPSLSGEGQSD